jgi:hypothetical protein
MVGLIKKVKDGVLKMKKLIILFLLVFLSGCNAKYSMKINPDLTITEKVIIEERNENIYSYAPSVEGFIDNMITVNNKNFDLEEYQIEPFYEKQSSGVIVNYTYNNLDDFLEKTLLHNFFEEMTTEKNNDIITIKLFPLDKGASYLVEEDYSLSDPLFINAEVSMILSSPALKSNAMSINVEKKTYGWLYNKNNIQENLEITFKVDKKSLLKQTGFKKDFANKDFNFNLIIIGMVLFLTIIIILILLKGNKNNQI